MRLVVGISGSTGAIYGVRLLEVLRGSPDIETHLVVSPPAKQTIEYETGWRIEDVLDMATAVYDYRDIGAAISERLLPHGRHGRRPVLHQDPVLGRELVQRQPSLTRGGRHAQGAAEARLVVRETPSIADTSA